MAVIATDTFTEAADTNLFAHLPDTGTGWNSDTNLVVVAATDNLKALGTSHRDGGELTSIGTDQIRVTADLRSDASTSRYMGVKARISAPLTALDDGYEATAKGSGSGMWDLFLFRNVGGTRTQLGTYAAGIAQTTAATVVLEVTSSGEVVKLSGTTRITTTDGQFTGNNYAGVCGNGNNQANCRIDNWQSESISGGTANPISFSGSLTGAGSLVKNINKPLAGVI